jgi:UDP-N-acetylmuramyl pentapeptide phosphotransferase/UDP-N-acetylglucosamine-1-phosphate transferase
MRTGSRLPFPVISNYRGKPVPVFLGIALVGAIVLWLGLTSALSFAVHGELSAERHRLLWMLLGLVLVCAAGVFDDRRPSPVRGVLNQLSLLARGRISAGIVKMTAIVGASALVVWMLGGRGGRFWLGVPVVSGAANAWNLLDVVPGRALKLFIPAVIGLGVAGTGTGYSPLAAGSAGGAVLALFADLREWAMLGDAGSNVLGFIVGIGLFLSLTTTGLLLGLAVLVLVHVISETITLSRVIERTPPLRWLDELGRAEKSPSNR